MEKQSKRGPKPKPDILFLKSRYWYYNFERRCRERGLRNISQIGEYLNDVVARRTIRKIKIGDIQKSGILYTHRDGRSEPERRFIEFIASIKGFEDTIDCFDDPLWELFVNKDLSVEEIHGIMIRINPGIIDQIFTFTDSFRHRVPIKAEHLNQLANGLHIGYIAILVGLIREARIKRYYWQEIFATAVLWKTLQMALSLYPLNMFFIEFFDSLNPLFLKPESPLLFHKELENTGMANLFDPELRKRHYFLSRVKAQTLILSALKQEGLLKPKDSLSFLKLFDVIATKEFISKINTISMAHGNLEGIANIDSIKDIVGKINNAKKRSIRVQFVTEEYDSIALHF